MRYRTCLFRFRIVIRRDNDEVFVYEPMNSDPVRYGTRQIKGFTKGIRNVV
jgi:hypothetical protein